MSSELVRNVSILRILEIYLLQIYEGTVETTS